jgi:hypothetical protein
LDRVGRVYLVWALGGSAVVAAALRAGTHLFWPWIVVGAIGVLAMAIATLYLLRSREFAARRIVEDEPTEDPRLTREVGSGQRPIPYARGGFRALEFELLHGAVREVSNVRRPKAIRFLPPAEGKIVRERDLPAQVRVGRIGPWNRKVLVKAFTNGGFIVEGTLTTGLWIEVEVYE